jgi:hypothetical protein
VNARLLPLSAGVVAGLCALAGAAQANDSTAEFAAGGLVLTKTADIEMRLEDLYVSTQEIRVTYHFFNRSPQDKTVTVAFPVPDVPLDFSDPEADMPHPYTVDFLGFSTKADGKPVTTEAEVKAMAKGVDQAALLQKLGIPLYPEPDYDYHGLDALPAAQGDELVRLGLAIVADEAADGRPRHLLPDWTLRTTYHFEQTFPAGREVVIEHRYKPAVGGIVVTSLGDSGITADNPAAGYPKKYCVDKDILSAIDRAKAAVKSQQPPFSEQRVSYILKTAANWAAPIKDFRLVVDKGDPANLVSFCGDGVKKISPTQFEIRKTDFTPTADLDVLILTPIGK